MKTLRELYNEVLKSEELKKAFTGAVQSGTAADFLKAHGCGASAEELAAFLKEQQAKTGELGDDELDSVSGGCIGTDVTVSVIKTGPGCMDMGAMSASSGQMKEGLDGNMYCTAVIA